MTDSYQRRLASRLLALTGHIQDPEGNPAQPANVAPPSENRRLIMIALLEAGFFATLGSALALTLFFTHDNKGYNNWYGKSGAPTAEQFCVLYGIPVLPAVLFTVSILQSIFGFLTREEAFTRENIKFIACFNMAVGFPPALYILFTQAQSALLNCNTKLTTATACAVPVPSAAIGAYAAYWFWKQKRQQQAATNTEEIPLVPGN